MGMYSFVVLTWFAVDEIDEEEIWQYPQTKKAAPVGTALKIFLKSQRINFFPIGT